MRFIWLEYVTGLKVTALNATLLSVVPGRRVDDDCTALLRYDNGASGVLMASQIAAGEGNGLRLRVYGENGIARLAAGRSEPAAREVARWAGRDSPCGGRLPERGCARGDAAAGRASGGIS